MNNLINNLLIATTTILTLALSLPTNAQNTLEKLYTQARYPYEPLVKRSQLVRILYHQDGKIISCRAEVTQDQKIWIGRAIDAQQKDFVTKPLRACLSRSDAKRLLKNTYQ